MSDPTVPSPAAPARLSPTVIALGFVSLFTDMSSEMVYTQIPLFLTGVLGAPKWVVGLIEGIAESAASLLRLVSGWISDRMGSRKPLTMAGYGLGAISKPLMALAKVWPIVLALRFLDRFGKGLRTAPRDALIAESTPAAIRGRAFGLHRTMDTTGAVLGPLLGFWFLQHVSSDLRNLFLFAGLPGLLAVLTLLLFVNEDRRQKSEIRRAEDGASAEVLSRAEAPSSADSGLESRTEAARPPALRLPRWGDLRPSYRRFLLITLLFNLGNSSDAFLILRAKSVGFQATEILLLYAAFNMVEALLGYAAGHLSDRVGRKPLIVVGYGLFALVYLGFAFVTSKPAVWGLFLLYGGYYTLTQGTQRAFAADFADPAQRATQIGAYHMVVGIALLPASILAGALFDRHIAAPFLVGAATAALSAFLLAMQPTRGNEPA
jgi:MFS family permease